MKFTITGDARKRILHSAAILFAAGGYSGASTRQIANRAHVNETTIYRVFKSKQQLYSKVLESKLEASSPDRLVRALKSRIQNKRTFEAVAKLLWREFDPGFVRLLLFGALQQPRLLKRCMQPGLTNLLGTLQEYVRAQVDGGTLKRSDPVLMAHALVAMLYYHRVFNDLIGSHALPRLEAERAAKLYLDIWLNGVSEKPAVDSRLERSGEANVNTRASKKKAALRVRAASTRWGARARTPKEP